MEPEKNVMFYWKAQHFHQHFRLRGRQMHVLEPTSIILSFLWIWAKTSLNVFIISDIYNHSSCSVVIITYLTPATIFTKKSQRLPRCRNKSTNLSTTFFSCYFHNCFKITKVAKKVYLTSPFKTSLHFF